MATRRKKNVANGKKRSASRPKKRGAPSLSATPNPIKERYQRTRSKQGKKLYGSTKKKVETNETIGDFNKQTLRVRGNAKQVREQVQDFLSSNAKKSSKVWVNFGTGQNGFWFGSKVGGLNDAYAYAAARAAEYGKRFGINSKTQIIGEAVILTRKRKKRRV